MAGQFRQRRFGGRGGVGEDVNPSAYIVNLADCMLVLACGVIVALVSYWNVDLTGIRELQEDDMRPVDPQTMPEDIGEGSNYYVEAGTVYMDPATGELYMVEDAESAENEIAAEGAEGADDTGGGPGAEGTDETEGTEGTEETEGTEGTDGAGDMG